MVVKAQMNIIAVVLTVIGLLILSYMLPTLVPVITTAIGVPGLDNLSIVLLQLVIPILILGFILNILGFSIPQRVYP